MMWDVVIVGAGAAGLMTAIQVSGQGRKVLLLDGQPKIGAKILMSGGTRCNVTNLKVSEKDFESNTPRVIRNILAAFPSAKTIQFFESLGVEFALEEGGKYFPKSNSARTILEALEKERLRSGALLETGKRVESVRVQNSGFWIRGKGFEYQSKFVVICTGGLSYPGTGSDGKGYEIARQFGHSLVATIPALTPLYTDDPDWKSLSGVALPCRLDLKTITDTLATFQDALLFTHFGFSGPVALNMSRHWLRHKEEGILRASFLPLQKEEDFRSAITENMVSHPDWSVKRFLSLNLPERFSEVILRKSKIPPDRNLNQLRREEKDKLVSNLFVSSLPVTGVFGYAKAEATAGGVPLDEVDPRTLESKKHAGLFFAGEVLDVDGRIGGFNFQWAWSSGYVVAQTLKKGLATGKITP